MYSLVKFTEDNILYITSSKALTKIDGNLVWAPYQRMGFYEAIVLAKNNRRWVLNKMMGQEIKKKSECQSEEKVLESKEKCMPDSDGLFSEGQSKEESCEAKCDELEISAASSKNSASNKSTDKHNNDVCHEYQISDEEDDFMDSDYIPEASEDEENDVHIPSGDNIQTICDQQKFDSDEEEREECKETMANQCIKGVEESICVTQPSGLISIEHVGCSGKNLKKYFCKYCNKLITKIARHLETVHKNENEVQAFSRLPKGCVERKEIIKLLRGAGSFIHNTNVHYNTGNLQVSRRPQRDKIRTVNDYMVCPRCKNFYSKTSLRKHAAKCLKTDKRERNIMVMGRRVRSDIHPDSCTVMKNSIFPFMRHDKIISLIKYDELVIKFFNEQCLKYRSQHHHKMIRSQLRLMARFFDKFIVATNNLVKHFSSVFCPKNFEKVLEAISTLGQYDENSNVMTKPNVPLFIGTLLKKMAKFYKSLSILKEDSLGQKNAENFLSLIDTHFNPHIGQTVLESKLYFSRQKKQDIPTDEDVLKLLFYLLRNIKLRFDTLSRTYSYKNWLELAAFCLMWIISFNRRRVGEVERMKIIDFKNYQRVDKSVDKDIYNSLSLEGKQAVEDFIRIQLRGKLGRTVPLLLCKIVFSSISLILDLRKDANVPDENPYVFGLPGKEREYHIEACPLLREHSEKCGAKNPHLLRGTKLRKHIATKSVMLNLNDQEVSDLANYMGHNERIHKSHYRLPIVAREISEISKILLKAQGVEHSQLNMFLGMHTSREQALEDSFAEMNLDISENAAHSTPYIAKRNKTASMLLPTDKKVPWNSNEKEVVRNHFKSHISMGRTPKLQECFDAIDKCGDVLQERSPQAIKSWVNNKIKETDLVMKNRICVRKRWTSPERMTLEEYFRENYDRKTIPTLRKCQDAIDKFIILKDRTPAVIRAKINNDLKKAKRTSVENS